MKRRDFGKALAAAGATLAASRAFAGPATSGMRSNFAFKKEDTPVILEVAINGSATKKVNPTAPETPAEIAQQAIECLDAGATIIHAHTNKPMEDADAASQVYIDAFNPVREKHPDDLLYLVVPSGYRPEEPTPLVVFMHGGGKGSPRSPLDGIGERLSAEEIRKWIIAAPELEDELSGRVFRTKQAYGKLPEAELSALVAYLQMLGTLVDFSTFTPDASR